MNRFSFINVIKFLFGILLIQAATALLVLSAVKTQLEETWYFFALLALALGVLGAFWFVSITQHASKDAIARTKENFSKEREKIRVQAEKEKNKLIKQGHQQLVKEKSRAQTKASLKLTAAFAGLAGMGALMVFTQFFTIGLLALSTAGGALAGYAVRIRQEYSNRKQQALAVSNESKPIKIITKPQPPISTLENPMRKSK